MHIPSRITHTKTNVIQYNEYYPFGLQTANSWTRESVTGNNFLYNGGAELNVSTGWYDTYYRNYDPVLGRFVQVDPLAAKYAGINPYQYALNSPGVYNDPLGLEYAPAPQHEDREVGGEPPFPEFGGGERSYYQGGYKNVLVPTTFYGPMTPIGMGPGSGNHWSDANSSATRDYFLMDGSDFEDKYGQSPAEFQQQMKFERALSHGEAYTGDIWDYGEFGNQMASYHFVDGRPTGYTTYAIAVGGGGEINHYGIAAQQGDMAYAGLGLDAPLGLLSTAMYAGGVYEEIRAAQIAKYTKGYLQEWQQIRNFDKGYKTARQATLAKNIINNVNMLDGIKVGARRMVGVGLVLGVADMANNDFSAESVGWFAADTIMTGVAMTGWGAPVAGVYFFGRFAYGIYEMATKE